LHSKLTLARLNHCKWPASKVQYWLIFYFRSTGHALCCGLLCDWWLLNVHLPPIWMCGHRSCWTYEATASGLVKINQAPILLYVSFGVCRGCRMLCIKIPSHKQHGRYNNSICWFCSQAHGSNSYISMYLCPWKQISSSVTQSMPKWPYTWDIIVYFLQKEFEYCHGKLLFNLCRW